MSNKKRDAKALGREEPLNGNLMLSNRQCPATSKRTGERCKRYCAMGQRTCVWHGSATRRSKTAAARRIAQASGYAAELLVELMADPEVDLKTRTQIAQDLLTRAGVSGKQIIEVDEPRWSKILKDVLVDADTMAYDVALPGDNFDMGVIEAVVVDDPDDVQRDVDIATHQRERAEAKRKNLVPPQRTLTPQQEAQQTEYERRVLAAEQPKRRGRATMTRR